MKHVKRHYLNAIVAGWFTAFYVLTELISDHWLPLICFAVVGWSLTEVIRDLTRDLSVENWWVK